VARSFARIFYRNAFNTGLAALECEDLYDSTDQWDLLQIDPEAGIVISDGTDQEPNERYYFLLRDVLDGRIEHESLKPPLFQKIDEIMNGEQVPFALAERFALNIKSILGHLRMAELSLTFHGARVLYKKRNK
jgi:3-isopropylmalate dehydratase small subunit